MKKKYVRPVMVGEMFTPDEYCSTCGATGEKTYKFVCDAPRGKVYLDDGTSIGYYEPCGKTHEVTVSNSEALPFHDGFVDRNGNRKEDEGENAIIWLQYKNGLFGQYLDDWHASAQYRSITDIEVSKS